MESAAPRPICHRAARRRVHYCRFRAFVLGQDRRAAPARACAARARRPIAQDRLARTRRCEPA